MPGSKYTKVEDILYSSGSEGARKLDMCQSEVHRRCVSDKFPNWNYVEIEYIIPDEQECSVCGKVKPIEDFPKYKKSKSGRRGYCTGCKNEMHSRWRKNNPNIVKEMNLKYSVGINLEEYNRLFGLQEGCCAICGIHQSKLKKRLAVDHCHETGEIRSLLCSKCNCGLGQYNDDIVLLEKAIKYLKKYK